MITLPQHGSQDPVRKSRCAATGQPAGEIDGFVDGRVRRRLENQQFVEADPQHLPNRFFEFLRVTFEEMVDQKVEAALPARRSEEHTSELQSRGHLVCRLLLEKKKKTATSARRTHDRCATT